MSAAEKVKSIFSGLGSSYTTTPLTFTEIDVQKNKKKMRLKEEGTQRGSKNLPKPDAVDFDDVEQQIISWINNEAKTAAEDMHTHLISFQHRIQSMRGIGNVAKIDQIASLAEDSFSAKVQSTKAELFTVRESVRHIKVKFESFKNKYNLQGEASYPQSRFLHFSIVALIVGVETLVNGKFFGKVSDG